MGGDRAKLGVVVGGVGAVAPVLGLPPPLVEDRQRRVTRPPPVLQFQMVGVGAAGGADGAQGE